MQIHCSFDDVFESLISLNKREYPSVFDQPFFSFLKKIHDRYQLNIACYVFYESTSKSLKDVSGDYINEFCANSSWLKFGFHSLNSQVRYAISTEEEVNVDYDKVSNELIRIVGKDAITECIRLHYIEGNYQALRALKNKGVNCLLTAEDERLSYHFTKKMKELINKDGFLEDKLTGLSFQRTNLRVENVSDIITEVELQLLKKYPVFTVFSHEWAMKELDNQYKLYEILKQINKQHQLFDIIES